jgi:LDH2 family malate/lactate/ureidoglycolate dehydrogenase
LHAFKKTAGDILRELRNPEKAPGAERIDTCGEKEHLAWLDRKEKGAPIDDTLQKQLIQIRDEQNLTNTASPSNDFSKHWTKV